MANKWLSDEDVKAIALAAAEAIDQPGAYSPLNLSIDSQGKSVSVYDDHDGARSADGWVLKKAHDLLVERFPQTDQRRLRQEATRALEAINKMVIREVGSTLVTLNDDLGRRAAIAALRLIAADA